MFDITHVIYNIHGLGRFILRPLKFYSKKKNLKKLLDKFADRRDNRGIMIRNELIKRYESFEKATLEVDFFNEHIKKRMFKKLRHEQTENNLEEQI